MRKTQKMRPKKNQVRGKNIYRAVLVASHTAVDAQSYFFHHFSEGEIFNGYAHVKKSKKFSNIVNLTIGENTSKFYEDLVDGVSIEKILAWAAAIFLDNKKKLEKLHYFEEKITRSVLDEDYKNALIYLDRLDDVAGISIWSISVRAGLFKSIFQDEGYEKIDSFVSEAFEPQSLVYKITSSVVSRKFDSAISVSRGHITRKQIMRDFRGPIKSLLHYYIVPRDFGYDEEINYLDLLQFEKQSSLVDFYKSVMAFLSYEMCNDSSVVRSTCVLFVKRLCGNLSNPIIDGAAELYGFEIKKYDLSKEYDFLDLYSEGKYNELCDRACRDQCFIYNFSVFEIVAKSVVRSGFTGEFNKFFEAIIDQVRSIMICESSMTSGLSFLLYLCDSFYELNWFKEFHCYIVRSSRSLPEKEERYVSNLSLLYSSVRSPKKLAVFSADICASLEGLGFADSTTAKLICAFGDRDKSALFEEALGDVSESRLRKYRGRLFHSIGDYCSAIDEFLILRSSGDSLDELEALRLLSRSYLLAGRKLDAIRLFVNTVFESRSRVHFFDVYDLAKAATEIIKSSSIDIDATIVLSIFSRDFDDSFDSALRFSFDRYLDVNGISDPRDLIRSDVFLDNRLVYFLRYVCDLQNLKLSLKFLSRKDIEDFRIDVCKFLILKGVDKEVLSGELKEITRGQVLRDAIKHVDNSRISADVSSFRDSKSVAFRAAFDNYSRFVVVN